MKILVFDQFAEMPEGTIFSYFQLVDCEGLYRKGSTVVHEGKAIDFFEASLVARCWNGESPQTDSTETRWGLFEYDQLFAVYEPDDVAKLKTMLG